MEYVEDVKRPLKKGELFKVPCLVRYDFVLTDEENLWLDLNPINNYTKKVFVAPVINHPHNDVENGQKEIHYHLDYRFIKHNGGANFPKIINDHPIHTFEEYPRPTDKYGKLEYFVLPVVNEDFTGITPVELIKKSRLKYKCIHKGKCPHKGFDLSQVQPVNGKITCPLHGLMFDAKSKELVKHQKPTTNN